MRKLPKYRIERQRANGWAPLYGGRAVPSKAKTGISLYIKNPSLDVLLKDQVIFAGAIWRILGTRQIGGMLRLHLDRQAIVAGK